MFSDDAYLVRTAFLVFLFALDFKTFFFNSQLLTTEFSQISSTGGDTD